MNRAERGRGTEERENQVEPLKTAKASLVAENMENCTSISVLNWCLTMSLSQTEKEKKILKFLAVTSS